MPAFSRFTGLAESLPPTVPFVGPETQERARIERIAQSHGFAPIASATNFVTIDCGRDAAYAKAILDGLVSRGVFIRMPGVAPLNRCIRISTGPEAELDIFEKKLAEVIAELG